MNKLMLSGPSVYETRHICFILTFIAEFSAFLQKVLTCQYFETTFDYLVFPNTKIDKTTVPDFKMQAIFVQSSVAFIADQE